MRLLAVAAQNDLPEVYLLRGLKERGINLEVICRKSAPLQEKLGEVGIGISHLKLRSRIEPSAIFEIRKKILAGVEIIHAFSSNALSNSIIASFGTSVKIVAYRGTIGHLSKLDPSSWLTFLNPRVNKIICVSDAVRRFFVSLGMPAHKLTTIYKGHDPGWYRFSSAPELIEFGIPPGSFTVCCVANLRAVKGVDTLLQAAKLLEQENIHFVLIGLGTERISAKDRTARIHTLGFRSDAAQIAGRCNLAVMPSREREGLAKAVIEAMAQGVPAVVTDIGGLPELVDESCGRVVPADNPGALGLAIKALYQNQNLAKELGRSALERIRSKFNIDQTISRTLAVYESLLNG